MREFSPGVSWCAPYGTKAGTELFGNTEFFGFIACPRCAADDDVVASHRGGRLWCTEMEGKEEGCGIGSSKNRIS
jgi:hypothetical protein